MNEDLQKRLITEIQKSGFPLELEVAEQMRNADFLALPNLHYKNSDGDAREIDVYGILLEPGAKKNEFQNSDIFTTHLITECKKSDKYPWIFFKEISDSVPGMGMSRYCDIATNFLYEPLTNFSAMTEHTKMANHHYSHLIPICKSYMEAFRGESNYPSAIFKAISSVLYARKYVKDHFLKRNVGDDHGRIGIFNPLIVFQGNLTVATKIGLDFTVESVGHIMLCINDTITGTNDFFKDEIIIDIIADTYLPEFIKLVRADMTCLIDHVAHQRQAGLIRGLKAKAN